MYASNTPQKVFVREPSTGDFIVTAKYPDSFYQKSIPVGIYSIEPQTTEKPQLKLKLLHKNKFEVPSPDKLRQDVDKKAEFFVKDYVSSEAKTNGLILEGNKGSGKSVLIKLIANSLLDKGVPIILISEAISVSTIVDAISLLPECMIIIDEFDTIYPPNEDNDEGASSQSNFISFLDGALRGTFNTKILIAISTNYVYRLNSSFLGRPSRFRYLLSFAKVPVNEVINWCKDEGLTKLQEEALMKAYSESYSFNIDMFTSIVDILKKYPEMNPEYLLGMFNIERDSLNTFIKASSNFTAVAVKFKKEYLQSLLKSFITRDYESNFRKEFYEMNSPRLSDEAEEELLDNMYNFKDSLEELFEGIKIENNGKCHNTIHYSSERKGNAFTVSFYYKFPNEDIARKYTRPYFFETLKEVTAEGNLLFEESQFTVEVKTV